MKKLLSVFIALTMIISMSVFPVHAADGAEEKSAAKTSEATEKSASKETSEKSGQPEKDNTEDVNGKIASAVKVIEKLYGISVKYPKDRNGNAMITMNNIETLDRSFSTITPNLVKQVSSYYEKKNGKKIEIQYYFSNSDYSYNGGVLMAAFEPKTSQIYVFLPSRAGSAIISGENPIALVHEMGHAFHLMCMDLYGGQKMETEWKAFNKGSSYSKYGLYERYNKNTFISGYARTSYEEDFAETFGHAFARTADGTGFYKQLLNGSETTQLGKKVNYIEKLIKTYIKDSSSAVENLRKIYKTPMEMKFEGITFYGETLQYIGYPQPRNILKGILNGLEIESQKSTWIRALGAWRVIDTEGDMYYLFPGGMWARAVQERKAA